MRILIALMFVAACSKSDTKSGAANDCEVAVERGVNQTIAKRRGPDAPQMTPEEAAVPTKLKAALAKSCAETKWSADVIQCFKTADDMATCKAKLTPEQRGAYSRAAMGVMQGAGGMGGMGPAHGMGGPGGPGMGGPGMGGPGMGGPGGPGGPGMGGPPGGGPPGGGPHGGGMGGPPGGAGMAGSAADGSAAGSAAGSAGSSAAGSAAGSAPAGGATK